MIGLAIYGCSSSPKTERNIHVVIRKALSDAVARKRIVSNPAASPGVAPKSRATKQVEAWSGSQVGDFLDHIGDDHRFRLLYEFLFNTGARRGEALALTFDDLNVVNGRAKATISKALFSIAGSKESIKSWSKSADTPG